LEIVCLICATIFIGISVNAQKRKSPVNFWSTSKVNKDEIDDIPSYNKANVWSAYGLVFILIGIISFIGYVDIASYSLIFAAFSVYRFWLLFIVVYIRNIKRTIDARLSKCNIML